MKAKHDNKGRMYIEGPNAWRESDRIYLANPCDVESVKVYPTEEHSS